MTNNRILVVGAGYSGAVIARELAEKTTLKILVIDQRDHIGGNCHTSRDDRTGVMVHHYGPHIFNTSDLEVWKYIQRFGEFMPYTYRVKAHTDRGIFSLPVNLHTINQLFGRHFNPAQARAFIDSIRDQNIGEPLNFEEQALKMVGREIYETFLSGYTRKQWGCDPREISASVLKRLPVRFNYDDNYYHSRYQGIPVEGYTAIISRILDHPQIEIMLGTPFEPVMGGEFVHTIYSGPIDAYFGYRHGRLGYRTVTFERIDEEGDFQGAAQINYTSLSVPQTRICEHKHFAPWENHERTVAFREFSKATGFNDTPYYPIRRQDDMEMLHHYYDEARGHGRVSFVGRLGTYRYLDMDDVIAEGLTFARAFLAAHTAQPRQPYPVLLENQLT